jgi:nitrite reductase/ring-hydroxylating ferredoxin subunit
MNLVRRNILTLMSASFLSVFGQNAQAVAGPTIKCTKVGQRIIFRGYTYRCVKSKNKLIWKRGAKVVAPTAGDLETSTVITFVAKSDEIIEGEIKILMVQPDLAASFPVSVVRFNGEVIVHSAICTHKGCIVAADQGRLACPCHNAAFNAINGNATRQPHAGHALKPLPKFIANEDSGSIYITHTISS